MYRAFGRSERYGQIERLLLSSRTPLSKAEIARRTGVHRATIGRMEQEMIDQGIPLRYDDNGHLYIERGAYLSNIRLKLDEAVVLFLAARLLARYSDAPNANVVNVLEKLGSALHEVAAPLGRHIVATSSALRASLPAEAQHHQRTLEVLGRGWAEGRVLQITYRPLRSCRSFDEKFAPYLLEPSGIGFSIYAIGLAGSPGVLRTRKVERIERVALTDDFFDVPEDFDPNRLLAGAWAIWFDDADQPQRVTLRFSHFVARRVQETRWHPSQRTQEDAEGRVIWTAEVDAIQEMLPWIRGWGADCEVLEPEELRKKMKGEVAQLARLYGHQGGDLTNRQEIFDDIFG